jgi:hypothetical protein
VQKVEHPEEFDEWAAEEKLTVCCSGRELTVLLQ